MSKQEILDKYGKTLMRFYSYYKFSFTLRGVAGDGSVVIAHFGGIPDDIYEFELSNERPFELNEIESESIEVINDNLLIASYP